MRSLVLEHQGEREKALSQHQAALDEQTGVLGAEHPSTAVALGNVGDSFRMLGRPQEALAPLRSAISILGEHPGTTFFLQSLGRALIALGRASEAMPHQERAVAMAERLLGPEHPWFARALTGKARVHLALSEHAEARALASRAVELLGAHPGHPELGPALEVLEQSERAMGEVSDSRARSGPG